MRYRWAAALALLAAALARASAHSLEDAAAAAAAHTGSAGPDELMQMLHAASKKMSLEQLGELRAVMRHMKDSAERRSAAQREHPGGRRLLVDRTLRPAYSYNSGQVTDAHMSGRDYGVILYPKKPFVVIEDPPPVPGNLAVQDPGNLNQTRTPANGLLSGLTVDLLESVAVELGVTLRYYYPCARTNYDSTGACVDATDSDALNWLKDGDTDAMAAKYFGNMTEFCGGAETYQCFVASATEISAERVQAFRMTQPFMDTGFALVVKENKASPPLMSAFLPFSTLVWFMTIVEIIFVGMAFIFVEGYGTNEALWAAPDTSGLEGSAKVLGIISGFFVQLYDAAYWSTTILLGAADKAPTTLAGRVLVTTQLFFALIFLTLYTGGVATFLMTDSLATKVTRFQDFWDKSAGPRYNAKNTICVPKTSASVSSFLAVQLPLLTANTEQTKWNTVQGASELDCLQQVYNDEATATIYDHPIMSVELSTMKTKGMCGPEGGYCDKETLLSETACKDGKADWTSVKGTLILTGNVFNPFGYGLAFKKGTAEAPEGWDYVAFGQAIQNLRESKVVAGLEKRYIPDPTQVTCTSGTAGPIRLSFTNVSGLLILTFVVLFLGLGIGMMEHIIAIFVRFCPCCKPKEEVEDGDEKGDADKVLSEEEEGMKEEIHNRISQLQERLLAIESKLGVEDPPETLADGATTADVEAATADGQNGDFFGGILTSIKW